MYGIWRVIASGMEMRLLMTVERRQERMRREWMRKEGMRKERMRKVRMVRSRCPATLMAGSFWCRTMSLVTQVMGTGMMMETTATRTRVMRMRTMRMKTMKMTPPPASLASAGVIVPSPPAQNPSPHHPALLSRKRHSTAYPRAEPDLSSPEDLYHRPGTEQMQSRSRHQTYSQHVVALEDQEAAATSEGAEAPTQVPSIMGMLPAVKWSWVSRHRLRRTFRCLMQGRLGVTVGLGGRGLRHRLRVGRAES